MSAVFEGKIYTLDGFLPDPDAYREAVLGGDYRTYDFVTEAFHGILVVGLDSRIPSMFREQFGLESNLSFVRRSPLGQVEPNFIHTDINMGDWSALLYLNPKPDERDGTDFWTHNATGEVGNMTPHLRSREGDRPDGWTIRKHVEARFNRLVMFESKLFHSRSIYSNYGSEDGSRLVQVTFGKGDLCSAMRLKEAA